MGSSLLALLLAEEKQPLSSVRGPSSVLVGSLLLLLTAEVAGE